MDLSRYAIASALALLATVMLLACSAPDAEPTAPLPDNAAVVAATTAPSPVAPVSAPESAPVATVDAADLPTGPGMDRLRGMVGMSANLFALDQACAPGRTDAATVRNAARQVPGRQQLGLSDAQMDAVFDAEYAKARQKLDALTTTQLADTCKEIEDQVRAASKAGP